MTNDGKRVRKSQRKKGPQYRVELLGKPRFFSRDESGEETEIKLHSRQSAALLALLHARNQPLARERLTDLLWHEDNSETARANLRVLLVRLKKLVPDLLLTDTHTVSMVPENILWDTSRFEELSERGTASALTEAAMLYHGEFMDGFDLGVGSEFDPWLEGEREQWRERYNVLMRRLVDHFLSQSKGAKARPYLERWAQIEPESEAAYRQQMWLAWKEGRTEPAIAQYRKLVRKLERELGIGPEESTQNLYERIAESRDTQPVGTPEASPPEANLHALGLTEEERVLQDLYESSADLTSFIGREGELAELVEAIKAHRLVTVHGLGGVGKTRLVLEARRLLQSHFKQNVRTVYCEVLNPRALEERLASLAIAAKLASGPTLIVLDSFDIVGLPQRLLVELLRGLPQATVLVTSREPLRLLGERMLNLFPLPVDDAPVSDQVVSPAVQLFWQRANLEQLKSLELEDADTEKVRLVAYIVRAMSGIALGIEIAASQLSHMTLLELAELVRETPHMLQAEHRTTKRHESLYNVASDSWRRLNDGNRQNLMSLTEFTDPLNKHQSEVQVSTEGFRELARKGFLVSRQGQYTFPLPFRCFVVGMTERG